MKQQNQSIRGISPQQHRFPVANSGKLQGNAASYTLGSVKARCLLSPQRRCTSGPAVKLHREPLLFALAISLLPLLKGFDQIAMPLVPLHPLGDEYCVSCKAIYNRIYSMTVSGLRKDLVATFSYAHNKPQPRIKRKNRRGPLPVMPTSQVRPREIVDSQLPWCCPGDLINGEGNASAVGALTELIHRMGRSSCCLSANQAMRLMSCIFCEQVVASR